MKTKIKKFPLLISLIVSCAIVVASIFVLAFAGMNIGTSLAGGSQFEIALKNEDKTKEYTAEIKDILKDNGCTLDYAFVETKYGADQENADYTSTCLVVNITEKNISDSKEAKIIDQISAKLGIDADYISSIENITSSVKAKSILFVGLAVGIIAVCLFVFAWIRYNIFAGLSFILAILHNVILYLSLLIVTRVQLNLASIAIAIVLTLIMSAVLIAIYEKHREVSRLHIAEKETISETMIKAVKTQATPFVIVAVVVLVFALLMFFIPVTSVMLSAIAIIIALLVSVYTTTIVGPGAYAGLLEAKSYSEKAVLSRNDTVNKTIQKKIKKSNSKK